MGNQQPATNPKLRISLDDALIDMKLQSKQVARAATKSQKQCQQYMKKAKQALKKNNEDGAKLYLTSASQKKNQARNFQRTAVKMDIMCEKIKSMKSNENLVNMFSNLANVVNQQMNNMDAVQMATSMETLNQQMDNMMINNKMMAEIMQSSSLTEDATADQMLNVLRQEIALEDVNSINMNVPSQQTNINSNIAKNQVPESNSQNNPQNAPKNNPNQSLDPFLDELKDL